MVAGHRRRPALAGARLGRRAGHRRTARAVLPVAAARDVPRDGASGSSRERPRVLLLLHARDAAAEAAGRGGRRRRLDLRPDLLRARPPDEIARARGGRRAARHPLQGPGRARRRSAISCTGRSRSTTRTSRTSSILRSDRPARPITCRSSSTTSTWRSRTSSAATITSRTRRSRCCCTRRSGGRPPQFAHVPLILGPDKKRLSKRHGATSVMEYHAARLPARGDGELPVAARLVARATIGRCLTRDELIARVHARGDQRRQRGVQRREARLVQPAAHRAAADRRSGVARWSRFSARPACGATELAADRARVVRARARAPQAARQEARSVRRRAPAVSRAEHVSYDPAAVAKHLARPEVRTAMLALAAAFSPSLDPFDTARARSGRCARSPRPTGVKAAALIHATRVAVTGRAVSPGLFEVLELLGRDRSSARAARGSSASSAVTRHSHFGLPPTPARRPASGWASCFPREATPPSFRLPAGG